MGILQLPYPYVGQSGLIPDMRPLCTTDNLATITTAGYLNALNLEGFPLNNNSVLNVLYSYNQQTNSGTFGQFSVSISNGVITLAQEISGGNVVLPVVANHIATFSGTTGAIKDSANPAINAGSIQAGLSGTAGFFTSFPGTAANGSFVFKAINNTGNFVSTLSNSNIAQATVYSLPDTTSATANVLAAGAALVNGNLIKASGVAGAVADAGIAAANVQLSALTNPDNISDLIWIDVPCSAAALASGGSVVIQASSGAKQYKVRNILVNYSASGLSGGGGDRLLQVTDGTTSYNNAGITAALLGTPVNTVWGGTGNPLPGTVAMNTSTVAAANLVAKYAGGTADYAAGTVTISVLVQRVA